MKKIISLLVVLTMVISCLGMTALANDKLPECDVTILKGDDLSITDDFALDFGAVFEAVDTEETVAESAYKDYLCDFEISFSEDVNAILAGQYDNYQADWIILKTEAGETFGDLNEFGYKFEKDVTYKVMSTAITALQNEGIIDSPEEAIFTYADIVNLVSKFACGAKVVDEKDVDIKLELCLYNPENTSEKIVVGNPLFFNHAAAKAPEAKIVDLTKDELTVSGYDLSRRDYSEVLDFGMNFQTLDTVENLIDNPFADYSVDFEIEFDKDVAAVLAGQYESWDAENWVAIKAEDGTFDAINEYGYSFTKDDAVRIMKTGFASVGIDARIAYWEIVENIKEFNCGVKLTSNEDVKITLRLCIYETDGHGNETGFKYVVDEITKDYKAFSISEDATPEEVVADVNNASSVNDSNKDLIIEAIKELPVENKAEIKTEVMDAVADAAVVVTDEENLGVEINTIEATNTDIQITVEKVVTNEENTAVFDIDAYEGNVAEENAVEGLLESPVVVKIPLTAFGADVTGISALYHEHDGELTKIDYIVKNGYVIFTMNKFSSIYAITTTLVAGEATVDLVELTGAAEGTKVYDVVLKGDTFRTIQNFGAGEFVVNVNGDAAAVFALNPAFPANTKVYQYDNKYVIAIEDELVNIWSKDETYSVNNSFVLGTITVTGWGKSGTLEISDIIMNKHSESVVNGGTDTTAINVINNTASIDFDIAVPQRNLNVEVYLAHGVKNQAVDYQDMKIVVTDGGVVVAEAALGKNAAEFDEATNTYKATFELNRNNNYLVTVSGAGYRTSSKNVSLKDTDETVLFWNNIKDDETNFLAGDIVADDIIDIYDLSAVVAYFDQRPNNTVDTSIYSKYDLNRDGVINSKDIIIVTNGWNK